MCIVLFTVLLPTAHSPSATMTCHTMSTTSSVALLNQTIEKGPLTIFNALHSDPNWHVVTTDWNEKSWPVTPNTAVLHSASSWNPSGMTVFAKCIQSCIQSWLVFIVEYQSLMCSLTSFMSTIHCLVCCVLP